jgi:hypothetical protein
MCGASSTPKDAMNHNLDLLGCGIILAADISGLEVSQDSAPGDEELGTTLLCGHGKWFVDEQRASDRRLSPYSRSPLDSSSQIA